MIRDDNRCFRFSTPQAIRRLPAKDIFMIKFKPSNQNNAPVAKAEPAIKDNAETEASVDAAKGDKAGRKKSGKVSKTVQSEDTLI